ncbi:hypothetical protein [Corynebacterium crudilactis]|uniref:Y-family DNA polymerase n=1 Tax=Corynebacterium crudilactis TaxID=1652495 RepID=UPI001FE21B7E|nr:hypothetical protein [Corynebacterium crudilactis]
MDEDVPAHNKSVAIAAYFSIQVCGLAAWKHGVRRGMKIRQAQALCPELEVVDADVDRCLAR